MQLIVRSVSEIALQQPCKWPLHLPADKPSNKSTNKIFDAIRWQEDKYALHNNTMAQYKPEL